MFSFRFLLRQKNTIFSALNEWNNFYGEHSLSSEAQEEEQSVCANYDTLLFRRMFYQVQKQKVRLYFMILEERSVLKFFYGVPKHMAVK